MTFLKVDLRKLLSRPAVVIRSGLRLVECVMLLYVMDMTNSFVVLLSSMCLKRWTDVARRVTYLRPGHFLPANANTTIYDVKLTMGTHVSAALVLLALRALPCVALCCPAFVLCVPVGMVNSK